MEIYRQEETRMSQNTYELIALAMRYFFAGMMLLIVLRAGRGALIDSRPRPRG